MREIKFRAWDRVNKAFYGRQDELLENLGNFIKNPRYTIGQYTGLKDKNGKEVFEGDIVVCSSGRISCPHAIEWGGPNGMPGWSLSGTIVGTMGDYAWMTDEEIVGNIHENPELLS